MSQNDSNRTGLNRFYLAEYKDNPDRPVLWADLGNLLRISGIIFQGMGAQVIAYLPAGDPLEVPVQEVHPTPEEWAEIIHRTDDPQEFALDPTGTTKILQRKAANAISGLTQQGVWARDDFTCVFCGRRMGDPNVVMSIDHWVPLELGGANDVTNYLTACTNCNKQKGSLPPQDFCRKHGYDYAAIEAYRRRVTGA